MACRCAKSTDQFHGYECEVNGGACLFLYPDSKRCAEMYGEGPDVDYDEEDDIGLDDDIIDKIIDEEGDFVSEEDEIDDIINNEEE